MFGNFLTNIRVAMGSNAAFKAMDYIVTNITLTSDFNRLLKYVISNAGNVLPQHAMEDVVNVVETTIPMALATDSQGRYAVDLIVHKHVMREGHNEQMLRVYFCRSVMYGNVL